jgi:multisubunit Na+/H+ antiporter MnhF subunit
VNVWFVGATILLCALVLPAIVLLRGDLLEAVVALELIGTVAALVLLLIAEGYHRNSYYTLPLVLAFTNFVGVIVFVRFLADRRL